MKRFHIIVLLLLSLVPKAGAQQSLDSLLLTIERNNLELRSLQQQLAAEVLDVKSQNALNGPTVEYSPFYQKGYTGMAESELVVTEEFDFPTRYAQRNRQAGLVQTAGERRYMSVRRQVLLEARLTYFDIVRCNQQLQLLHQRMADNETVTHLLQKRMDAGDANVLELNKARMDRMEVLTQVNQTEAERLQLLGLLRTMNGGQDVEVGDTIMQLPHVGDDAEAFIRQRMQTDADILAAEAQLAQSDYEVSMSKSEWLPSLSVGYRRNTERGEALNGFLVGASFPLTGTKNKVRAARLRQQSAQLDVDQARQQLEASLRAAYAELMTVQRTLEQCDTRLLNESLQLLGKALQHGQITALQYYAEVNDIYDKLLLQIGLRCDAAKLHARMFLR